MSNLYWTACPRLAHAAAAACLRASVDPQNELSVQLDASEAAESLLKLIRAEKKRLADEARPPWED